MLISNVCFVSVEATMLKFENDSEIEVEQGQTFDIVVNCTNPDGERSHGKRIFRWFVGIQNCRRYLLYDCFIGLKDFYKFGLAA